VIERDVSWRIWRESRRFQERGRPKGDQREEEDELGMVVRAWDGASTAEEDEEE
jgi:hypothetical protein